MTTPKEQPTGPIDQILADCNIFRRRLKSLDPETVTVGDLLMEMTENLIPLIIATNEQIAEVDDVVLELTEKEGSYLEPMVAQQLQTTFALGDAVITVMREFIAQIDNDIATKRYTELCDGFEQSLEISKMAVESIIVASADDDDDDMNEEDEDDAGSDGDDGTDDGDSGDDDGDFGGVEHLNATEEEQAD